MVYLFPLKAGFVKNIRELWCISEWFFPPSLPEAEGIILQNSWWNLVKLGETHGGKSHKIVAPCSF